MTVQDLSVLHRRYIDVSNRFRAAWTFHQYVQGLQKIFPEEVESSPGLTRAMGEFQGIYNELKTLSQKLNASEAGRVRSELDGIESHLRSLTEVLLAEDARVSPSLCRQFFQRVKNYDEKILTQLAKFYVLTQEGDGWVRDRLDKVDFLLTKLAEEPETGGGPAALRPITQLRELFQGLWSQFGYRPAAQTEVDARVRSIDEMRQQIGALPDFDQLNESGAVRRYRELKHSLGSLFFQPEVLLALVETNLVLKNVIRNLYQKEEQRIVAEYQRVFELEREAPVDSELDQELARFHEEIEAFERQLQDKNVRLEHLASIREQVRSLLPRLSAGSSEDSPFLQSSSFQRPIAGSGGLTSNDEVLAASYQAILSALEVSDREATPRAVTLMREIYPYRLEPREIVAYRRLTERGEVPNRELEQFLLEAAALRNRINEEAAEITGILDDTVITREAPVFSRARRTSRVANRFLWRFSHHVDDAVQAGDIQEAQNLQVLRMRLMRDYSGLWLLANKP